MKVKPWFWILLVFLGLILVIRIYPDLFLHEAHKSKEKEPVQWEKSSVPQPMPGPGQEEGGVEHQKKEPLQNSLSEEKQMMELCWPVFDYTVRKFEGLLKEVSIQTEQPLFSDFTGLPTTFSSGTYVARMTNSVWKFNVSVIGMKMSFASPPHFRILSSAPEGRVLLDVTLRNNQVVLDIQSPQGSKKSRWPISDYKRGIDQALQSFIAIQTELVPLPDR